MKHLSAFLLQAILIPFVAVCGIKPINLTCEYLINPAVVDVLQPRLSWVNEADSGERGQFQTAYQIRVASTPGMLATPDLWESHKIPSPETNRIVYNGKPLSSRQECWWQVRVWVRNGRPSDWSAPAFWRMGLLHPSDWQAMWIGAPWQGEEALPPTPWPGAPLKTLPPPAPLLRKAFYVQKEVVKAFAFVTGLGSFELYVNGSKVTDDELVPNQTNYGKRPGLPERSIPLEDSFREYRVMYLAYDITSFLRMGENVVGAMLGNGFYNPGKFWCEGFGTRFFFEVLAENGLQDLAFEAMNKKTYPSYGYWLKKGATTTRKRWNNDGSHNHLMFGGGLVWFYRNLAGIQADWKEPGFKHIVFKPQPVPKLDRVTYYLQTPYGIAGIEWIQNKDRLTIDILVPSGSHATVYVPAKKGSTVLESGRKPSESPFLKEKGWKDSCAVFEIASGAYQFMVEE